MSTTIATVAFRALNLPLTESFAIATGAQQQVQNVVVQITLQNGTTGLGEAAPFPAVSGETQQSTLDALQQLQHLLIGQQAGSWAALAARMAAAQPHAAAARCALEMALLDALCRHHRMPLYVFFGGCGTRLQTDMTIPAGDVAHAAASARAITARGIRTIKVKTEGTDVHFDAARLKAIHEAAPEAPLIVDGNCGYNTTRALEFVQQLRKAGIRLALFEQPVPRDDWDAMATLTRQAGVPIAADESARSAADVLRIVHEKAAHAVNIKLMKAGVAEALQMISIAKAAGLELMIGGMVESQLAMSFSAHLAAGIGGFRYVDLDTPLFIREHPFRGGFSQKGDQLSLDPTAPGHGVTLPEGYFSLPAYGPHPSPLSK